MATTQDFVNWVCSDELMPEFLLYFFRAMRPEFRRLIMGSTHQTIYMPDAAKFAVSLPPRIEQRPIVSFLDDETRKIDALIAEQERLIELLTEKRRAVISHAVTKGLNREMATKESGVDGLGEIPAHWKLLRVRNVVTKFEQGWSPQCYARPAENDEWGVLRTGCVNGGKFNDEDNKSLPETLSPLAQYEVKVGDLILSRASGSPKLVGSIALVEKTRGRLLLSDKLFRVHLTHEAEPEFICFQFQSPFFRDQVERALSGADGLANNLPQSSLREFTILLPPRDEQTAIASLIADCNRKTDSLLEVATRAVELLSERRSALITAAVTGKIDVRNYQPTVAPQETYA
jgi:type I restriction enzyme S subunit